jgi:hypothetical protein
VNKEVSMEASGVAQVVECLPSKPEALSSNSSTTKEIKNKINKYLCFVRNLKVCGI